MGFLEVSLLFCGHVVAILDLNLSGAPRKKNGQVAGKEALWGCVGESPWDL